jgi:hypothetical protein
MPESTLTLCESRQYPPVRDFGFGLRDYRCSMQEEKKESRSGGIGTGRYFFDLVGGVYQRVLNDLLRTRLYRHRVIWLLSLSLPLSG